MLPNRSSLWRVVAALVLAIALARCTPGGQFDPSTLLDNDMFDTKTKLKGQREPMFPNGVPGATTGVPADLVKGYKPPADQADADPDAVNPPPVQAAQQAPKAEAKSETKPKPAPKPKVAIAHPSPAVEKPSGPAPTRIDIGAKGTPAQTQQSAQTNWPTPPGAAPQQDVAWPAPPPAAPAQQPAAAPASQPASQNGQSFDSMWPKSTGGTTSQ